MQSLIHCNGCRGHINTLRKCSQERAELAGTSSTGRDGPTIQHVTGMPCDRHTTKGHHAGLVVRDSLCLCQPWMVPGLQSISNWATALRDNTREEPEPRATLARASVSSLESSCSWQKADANISLRRRAVRMGGTFPVMRKGNQGGKEENFHYQGRIIRVGRMQDILRPCAKPQPTTHVHSG